GVGPLGTAGGAPQEGGVPGDVLGEDARDVRKGGDVREDGAVTASAGTSGGAPLDAAAGALDAWRPRLRAGRSAAADAAAARRRSVEGEEGLTERRRLVRELAAVLDDLRAEVEAADAWLAGRPEERAALERDRDAAREAAGRADAA